MNQPKFSVGEVVILQSKSRPKMNGEYTVCCILRKGDSGIDIHTGVSFQNSHDDLGYILDDRSMVEDVGGGCLLSISWHESALRKKHQPGTESFSEIMQRLGGHVTA